MHLAYAMHFRYESREGMGFLFFPPTPPSTAYNRKSCTEYARCRVELRVSSPYYLIRGVYCALGNPTEENKTKKGRETSDITFNDVH